MIEESIKAYLDGYLGLNALVGARIYVLQKPQDATLPAVVYQKISGSRTRSPVMGNTGLTNPVYQFSAYSTTYASAKAIAEQLRLALNNYSGAMGTTDVLLSVILSDIDGYDNDTKEYYSQMDFEFFTNETVVGIDGGEFIGGIGGIGGVGSASGLTSDVEYYGSFDNGSDDNDGLTAETPIQTVAKVLELMPMFGNNYTFTLNLDVSGLDTYITLTNKYGYKHISILGTYDSGTDRYTEIELDIENVLIKRVTLQYLQNNGSGHYLSDLSVVDLFNSRCGVTPTAFNVGRLNVSNCEFNSDGDSSYCEVYNTVVYSANITGTHAGFDLYDGSVLKHDQSISASFYVYNDGTSHEVEI